jgi:hypothetical protein
MPDRVLHDSSVIINYLAKRPLGNPSRGQDSIPDDDRQNFSPWSPSAAWRQTNIEAQNFYTRNDSMAAL